jgi:hypothetical protein
VLANAVRLCYHVPVDMKTEIRLRKGGVAMRKIEKIENKITEQKIKGTTPLTD